MLLSYVYLDKLIYNTSVYIEELIDKVDTLMQDKGWKHPECIKVYYIDKDGHYNIGKEKFGAMMKGIETNKDLEEVFRDAVKDMGY